MIDVNNAIEQLIATEGTCSMKYDMYKNIQYGIATAVEDGYRLTDLIDQNTYGMLREYMPEFDRIIYAMRDIVDKAMTVVVLWENAYDDKKEEETANAARTMQAFVEEFNECLNRFNALTSAIETNVGGTISDLRELGYIL